MSEELATYEAQPIDIVRQPSEAIAEAQKAAKALAGVVAGKKKPVIFNGEQYLEFEDWQTVGNFYGLTAKVISTTYIEYGTVRGFEAKAVTLNRYGVEISAAESMCLNDEPNWKSKPLFQLRSMAQTRACSKTLRNVLAWVVVLAGYKPTPAEEMDGVFNGQKSADKKPDMKAPQEKAADSEAQIANFIPIDITIKEGTGKKGKWTKYFIKGPDGEYSTFSQSFADVAAQAKDNDSMIAVTYKNTQFGNDIITVSEWEQQGA